MNFELIPHKSIGPLHFGMTAAEVDSVLGKPVRISRVRHIQGESRTYEHVQVGLNADGKLNHIGIDYHFPGKVICAEIDLFQDADALSQLCRLDGDPFVWVGFVMLLNLGVSLAGFHTADDTGKAANFFPAGRYDEFKTDFQPFKYQGCESKRRGQ